MKQYTVKPEYAEDWTNFIEDENAVITEEDLITLAREWDKPVEELLQQVDEIEQESGWIILDERDGDIFEEDLRSGSKAFAALRLIDTWERLSSTERRHHKLSAVLAVMTDGCVDYDTVEDSIEITDRSINVNNGNGTFYSPDEVDAIYNGDEAVSDEWFTRCWDVIVNVMDDDTRELIHAAYAPCTYERFLRSYLRIAPADLIVG